MRNRQEYRKEYRSNPEHKERLKITHHALYERKKEELKEKSRLYRLQNHEKAKATQRKSQHKLKIKVLTYYSNGNKPICLRCGIADVDVLTIDHINGGGSARRRAGIEHSNAYSWLNQHGYPGGFQVLCANCNLRKKIVEKC